MSCFAVTYDDIKVRSPRNFTVVQIGLHFVFNRRFKKELLRVETLLVTKKVEVKRWISGSNSKEVNPNYNILIDI
jgi:hypothetical protein